MAQITKMLMGVVLMGLVVGAFVNLYSGGIDSYNVTDYDNTTAETFTNELNSISNSTEETKDRLLNLTSNPNFFDKIQAFFGAGYSALKNIGQSFSIFFDLINAGVDSLPIGNDYSNDLKLGLGTLVLLAVIAAFFKVLFKVEV